MISIDMTKAKDIAHEKRRAARAEEFKPYDEVIMKQIPGNDAVQAEVARQAIRDKYADIQTNIDSANNVDALKQIVESL
jgi:hypothetical protein